MDNHDISLLDTKYEYTLLFDFYGALLNDKNYSIFEDYICNDMSLSEIAAEQGITRQGVRDTVNRSIKKLIGYEEKLGLIKRFDSARESVKVIKEQVKDIGHELGVDSFNNSLKCDENAVNSSCIKHYDIESQLKLIESMADSILEEL